jgi:predicted nucleic acid-binding protein
LSVFVDTSVWLLALRRDVPASTAQVAALIGMLENGDPILTTGFVLQELLQGFSGPKAQEQIIERFSALPLLMPERQDHIDAAELRNACRRHGVQAGTVDTLFAQLCIRHNLLMLTSDDDFQHIAKHCALRIWSSSR